MMTAPRRRWSAADIDRLFELRDVQQLTWREIGEAFDDNFASCCTRYFYYKDKYRLEAMRDGEEVTPRRESKPRRRWSTPVAPKQKPRRTAPSPPLAPAPKPEPVFVARNVAAPIKRPRYIHEADMDIIARIDRQGLTSGFLGDPPAGRSALDQRGSKA